jgi:hypothetical protein
VGFFYFDESIRDNGGFILGAFIYSKTDLTPSVSDALTAAGLQPGRDEFKSRFQVTHTPEQAALRAHFRSLLHKVKVGTLIIPTTQRNCLGKEALLGLTKFIKANSLTDMSHEAFFDEGITFAGSCLESLRQSIPSCEINRNQDSRLVGGIQLADLAAHSMGTMLLEEQGLISKKVKAGEYSGYLPELELSLGFELWSILRYSFFMSRWPINKGANNPPESIPEPWYNVQDYGLYMAPSCGTELRSAAIRRFGQSYLGCIHY